MITNIPEAADFKITAVALLNLAWAGVIQHLIHLQATGEDDPDLLEDYWSSAQLSINSSLSLAQQGIEFLLKSKICEASPFLLFAGPPRDWPKECDKKDTPFSEFRTIDAKDLIRCHDSVATNRLSQGFKDRFNDLRKVRNTIMHSVSKELRVRAADVVLAVLESCDSLIKSLAWPSLRRDYLERSPGGSMGEDCDIRIRLMEEYEAVIDLLNAKDGSRFLDFNKKQRRYLCPSCTLECASNYDTIVNLAQLRPNTPGATTVRCVICEQTFAVKREPCGKKGCKSDVLTGDDKLCLICNKCR
jgi:hypothetical protein